MQQIRTVVDRLHTSFNHPFMVGLIAVLYTCLIVVNALQAFRKSLPDMYIDTAHVQTANLVVASVLLLCGLFLIGKSNSSKFNAPTSLIVLILIIAVNSRSVDIGLHHDVAMISTAYAFMYLLSRHQYGNWVLSALDSISEQLGM